MIILKIFLIFCIDNSPLSLALGKKRGYLVSKCPLTPKDVYFIVVEVQASISKSQTWYIIKAEWLCISSRPACISSIP